jgi:hypothetical protein
MTGLGELQGKWVTLLAPQFARAETHRIEVLRILVAASIGVGKDGGTPGPSSESLASRPSE